MADHFQITLIPTGGLATSITASDQSLMKPVDSRGTTFITNDVGGYNWENTSVQGEVSKIFGHSKWNATPAATGGQWQEYFVLDDGTNRTRCGVYKGKFYTFDPVGEPTNIDNATPVTFHTSSPISLSQYGSSIIIASPSVTPQKWAYGETNLTDLIQTGTAYKFKFIDQFYNRIFGAYSDQTNGSLEIRWTDPLTPLASMTFPSANQLYKPDNDIGITGLKRMGNTRFLVYGRKSIHSIDYYQDISPNFDISPVATQIGTDAGWSIVDTGRSHCFLDRNQGFIELMPNNSWKIISLSINDIVQSINKTYYGLVVGKLIPFTREICWTVPIAGSSTPDMLLYYDMLTGDWRQEQRSATALFTDDYGSLSWTQFIAASPNNPKWPTGRTWLSFYSSLVNNNVFFGNTDGYTYLVGGNDLDGSDFGAFRVEPVFSTPDVRRRKRISELYFEFPLTGNFSIDVYWRTGETEKDCRVAAWTSLGSVSGASGSSDLLPVNQDGFYHQIKWGNSVKNSQFKATKIILRGVVL